MAPLGLGPERSAKKHIPYLRASLHLVCIPRGLVDADKRLRPHADPAWVPSLSAPCSANACTLVPLPDPRLAPQVFLPMKPSPAPQTSKSPFPGSPIRTTKFSRRQYSNSLGSGRNQAGVGERWDTREDVKASSC